MIFFRIKLAPFLRQLMPLSAKFRNLFLIFQTPPELEFQIKMSLLQLLNYLFLVFIMNNIQPPFILTDREIRKTQQKSIICQFQNVRVNPTISQGMRHFLPPHQFCLSLIKEATLQKVKRKHFDLVLFSNQLRFQTVKKL